MGLPVVHVTRSCRPRLWTAAFYAPAVALPLAARLLVLSRERDDLGLASGLKGAVFGCLQDAAVFLQTLLAVRVVANARTTLLPETETSATARRVAVLSATAVALGVLYLWLTLACLVDLSLLLRFMPRLNRGFVRMYLQFSSQFSSSIAEVLTLQMAFGMLLYAVSLVLWVSAVLFDKVELPRFVVLFCQSGSPASNAVPKSSGASSKAQRASITTSDGALFPWAMHMAVSSPTFRTGFLALLLAASALHATIALDGNNNDIYLLSNAMFSLEMEEFLRPPTKSHATATILSNRLRATVNATTTNDELVDGNAEEETMAPMNPFYERTIGRNEIFEVDEHSDSGRYPFWRKTVKYTGEKRFELKTNDSQTKPPPTVILINLESFRSREVGVLGGRDKVARYNQTVTPFFDSLSKSGVLFSQHYTPCVQTSRTLLSSLFGILPSMKDAAAVATFSETKLRFRGIPHILKEALNYKSIFWSAVNLSWEDWHGFLLANGFDHLVDDVEVLNYLSEERRDALTDDDAFSWGRHDAVSFEALENFLLARRNESNPEPLFLDVYTVSSHDPWKLPATFKPSTNYSTYLTEDNLKYVHSLNYVDQRLGEFITNMRQKGLMENTIVMIEGDHGFGRMEHGDNPTIVASYVYEEGSHVPMLLLADDFLSEKDKGLEVDDLTSQTDILATFADMLGIENFMQHGIGQSMLRKRNPALRDREIVLSNPFYGQTRGLRVGRDLKYARYGSGTYEVFNLTSDPLEQKAVEQGKLSKNELGNVIIGPDLNETTADALRFMEEVVAVSELMFDTNGFMPAKNEHHPHSESSENEAI